MSWAVILTPLIAGVLLAMSIGIPPVTGVDADLPFAAEEHHAFDAERRRAWRPSVPGLIVGVGAGATLALALYRLWGG